MVGDQKDVKSTVRQLMIKTMRSFSLIKKRGHADPLSASSC